MENKFYVQYGCGFNAPKTWRNFDCSPTLRFEKLPIIGRLYQKNPQRFPKNIEYGDIIKGLPLPPMSCKGIYAGHVLEHLSLFDLGIALKNTFSLLIPGGIFRLVVPDLEILAKNYLASDAPLAAEEFIKKISLGSESRNKRISDFIKVFFGNRLHLWMWDFKALRYELTAAGFVDIKRSYFGYSEDPKFKEVEELDRFREALCIECKRGIP